MRTIAAQIEALDDEHLEEFIANLLTIKTRPGGQYFGVDRIPAPGDMGRDVVAYLTDARLQGPWHNYQAKAYKKPLGIGTFLGEIGKLIFHVANGEFSLPSAYIFVCPRGMTRDVRKLVEHPDLIADRLCNEWDKHCSTSITETRVVCLTTDIKELIARFPFRETDVWTSTKIAIDPALTSIRVKWFKEDPGPPPESKIPDTIEAEEQMYIGELLQAYGQMEGRAFKKLADIVAHVKFFDDLGRQRTRYFKARAHEKHFRDNTMPGTVETFHDEIYDAVEMVARTEGLSAFNRMEQTMRHAAQISASGVAGHYAVVGVRQGACHILVNKGRLSWHW